MARSNFHDAGLDPSRVRVLSPAERLDDGATIEAPIAPETLRERLAAAKRALKRAEVAVRVARDLVVYLEGQR